MQINREITTSNVIRAWEAGRVRVGEAWYAGSIIVGADTIIEDWPCSDPGAVTLDTLTPAIELAPEIIVLGTGETPSIPDTALMAALASRAIGLEIMSTPAACRTYNVLVHEERRVVAALINPVSD